MANKKEKKKYTLLIIGIILFTIALIINKFTIIRLILAIISSILIMLNFKSNNKKTNFILFEYYGFGVYYSAFIILAIIVSRILYKKRTLGVLNEKN